MAVIEPTAPLSIAVELEGRRPSLAVAGRADHSNIGDVVLVLDRLAEEHEHCVTLDLGGLVSLDTAAASGLANSALSYGDKRKRLRLERASGPVQSMFDRLMLSGAFCVEPRCEYESCPGECRFAGAAWALDVFTLPSVLANCHEARTRVDQVAEAVGLAGCRRKDVMLAVGEAVTNAVEHGSPHGPDSTFTVSCLGTAEKFCVSVSDSGAGFCPDTLPSLEDALLKESGRGIHFMRAVMDDVSFHFDATGTTVRMVKLGF